MFETAGIADNNHSNSLIVSSINEGGVRDCVGIVWLEIPLSVHEPATYIISFLCLVSSCSSQTGNMHWVESGGQQQPHYELSLRRDLAASQKKRERMYNYLRDERL